MNPLIAAAPVRTSLAPQGPACPGTEPESLRWAAGLCWSIVAVAAFQVSYHFTALWFLQAVFMFACLQFTRLKSNRVVLRVTWLVGLVIYGPQLGFFWTIFGPGAVALWLVLATWLGLFLVLVRQCRVEFGRTAATVLAPVLWLGLEYFRSELYVLRFSWLNAGYLWSDLPQLPWISLPGMYGIGFLLMAGASAVFALSGRRSAVAGLVGLAVAGGWTVWCKPIGTPAANATGSVRVAGMQMEFPFESQILDPLTRLKNAHPEAQLLMLSEYTFDGPVPEPVLRWCQTNQMHLVVGGKDFQSDGTYFNTAYVVSPSGDLVFKQAKSVPIQFFKDGLPARTRALWESPWGRIGICICYDLSYTRVVDDLVRQGAQAILVPTMDVAEWGVKQHQLHARVAPVRSAEYGVPMFRVASSGISQLTDARGRVTVSAPFPGDEAMLGGTLAMVSKGRLPPDRIFAPAAVVIAVGLSAWFTGCFYRARSRVRQNLKRQSGHSTVAGTG